MKRILCWLLTLSAATSVCGQPVIQSFAPAQGAIGTTVNITGNNFSANPADNIVFFGATRATVNSATTTGLTVTVPMGTTPKPITVTVNGLTGYAARPFLVTFAGQPFFDASSFAAPANFTTGTYPRHASVADFDNDGKADVSVTNNTSNSLSVFKNSSVPGTITFTTPLNIPLSDRPFVEQTADIDGDGKIDIVSNGYNANNVYIIRNTTTGAVISFAIPVVLTTGLNPHWVDIADIDMDGRPDIFSVNQNANTISVFRNTSSPGNISFAAGIGFATGNRPNAGCAGDIDGDGKPDIAIANINANTVSVYRNTSTPGNISFAAITDFPTGNAPFNVVLADIDADDKKEMLVLNSQDADFSVYRNTATAGNISFAARIDFPANQSPLHLSAGDLNGDGKPDIAVANFNGSNLSVYRNISTTGNIALDTKFDYTAGSLPRTVPLADIDGDGRTDMVAPNSISNNFSVLRNLPITNSCGVSINTFPYTEGFETSNGNWTAGGTASDWAWGAPAKATINAAATGTNCWITGGLNNATYNSGENSWLMSPCFDFSSLQHPEINFDFFCETERRFDGASFQYSIDGGTSWTILGAANTSTPNCAITNWYNADAVTYLGNTAGWSGTSRPDNGGCLGGNGLGRWLPARHPLNMLAGQPDVRFRFRFGAGTQCNTFDGFAVDNIVIREAVVPVVEIGYGCAFENGRLGFYSNSICITRYQWDFGDPASGADNTSTASAPFHQFSALGRQYTVTLTAEFGTGIIVTSTQRVNIMDATSTVNWPGACNNTANATITVNPLGAPGNTYFYFWNTSPPQTGNSISNVGAGTHVVQISAPDACTITREIILAAPTIPTVSPAITDASCNNNNGSIALNITGGNAPFSYAWSNAATTATAGNLAPGSYTVTISDANGCTFNPFGPYVVKNDDANVRINLGADRNICPGQTITLSPGIFATYKWQDGSTGSSFMVTGAGTYYVDVTNAQGCLATDTIHISADCREVYFPSAFSPNSDGRNDGFGPLGNVFNIEKYSLRIFNRYGEMVFTSVNPLQKWDGTFKGSVPQTGAFTWMASYSLNGKAVSLKGTILLIR